MNHLITSPSDIYYLTGVRSHDPGEILIIKHKAQSKKHKEGIVFCDPRTTALFDADKFQIIDDRKKWGDGFKNTKYKIQSTKGRTVKNTLETDPDYLTQTLREKIEGYGVKLSMQKSPITQQRIVKSAGEIELIRESQRLNKEVYEMIVPFLVPGVTESAIARKIQILQLELGADGPSFPPIVAFAENTAIPHHSPTEKILQAGDPVLLDMGLIYKGYCSDLTRCTSLKKKEEIINKKEGSFDEIYSLLQKITAEIISWAKPGMRVSDLDKKAREMMGKYEPYFTHSLGHGVGIDIHEAPHISTRSEEVLEPGMVITIEPGIYFTPAFDKLTLGGSRGGLGNMNPGVEFGARYEEMVVVDKDRLLLI